MRQTIVCIAIPTVFSHNFVIDDKKSGRRLHHRSYPTNSSSNHGHHQGTPNNHQHLNNSHPHDENESENRHSKRHSSVLNLSSVHSGSESDDTYEDEDAHRNPDLVNFSGTPASRRPSRRGRPPGSAQNNNSRHSSKSNRQHGWPKDEKKGMMLLPDGAMDLSYAAPSMLLGGGAGVYDKHGSNHHMLSGGGLSSAGFLPMMHANSIVANAKADNHNHVPSSGVSSSSIIHSTTSKMTAAQMESLNKSSTDLMAAAAAQGGSMIPPRRKSSGQSNNNKNKSASSWNSFPATAQLVNPSTGIYCSGFAICYSHFCLK